jgi:ParB-like chromosome segregation protein Spo0J
MPVRKPGTRTKSNVTPIVTSSKKVKETSLIPDKADNPDLYYGYKVLDRTSIEFGGIKRVFNVRSLSNETAIDNELLESIKAVGVKNPLILNSDYELLDGHRRFYHAKQVFELTDKTDVIIIDIKPEEVAYFQYLTGLEKGHTKDERDTAILKFASANPELSDREIAKRFGLGSNATVSNLTKIIKDAPSLTKYVLSRQISKASAVDLVVEARKHKKEPEKVAKALIEELVRTDKLNTDDTEATKPITRTVTNKILSTLIPKYLPANAKSQSVPTAKKLLKDLFCHLNPVGDASDDRQEYNAHVHLDLIKQIELLLNGSIADRYKHKFHKEFNLERKTEYIKSDNLYTLWNFYTGLTLSSSITICLATEENYFFADENSEFMEDILSNHEVALDRGFHDGSDWCQIEKSVLSEDNLIEIAKKQDLHLLIIDLVVVTGDDEDEVTEIESKIEVKEILQPVKASATPPITTPIAHVDDTNSDDDDDIDYTSLLEEFTEVEIDEDTAISEELELDEDDEATEDDI